MLKFVFAFLAALVFSANAEFTTLQWSICSGASPALVLEKLTGTPMPFVHPGDIKIYVKGNGRRVINGATPSSLDIIRTVAGLALPVRCTVVQGINVGSCSYADFCKDVLNDIAGLNSTNCPPEFANAGINCKCPFTNIQPTTLDETIVFPISDLSTSPVSFLASGDFDITAKVRDAAGELICLKLGFTVKKA